MIKLFSESSPGEKESNSSAFDTAPTEVTSCPGGYLSDVSEQWMDGAFTPESLLSPTVTTDIWV